MFNKKYLRKLIHFNEYERDLFKAYLEKMALDGWMLVSSFFLLKFVAVTPCRLIYSVEDKHDSPSIEAYEKLGWKYIFSIGSFNIFVFEIKVGILPEYPTYEYVTYKRGRALGNIFVTNILFPVIWAAFFIKTTKIMIIGILLFPIMFFVIFNILNLCQLLSLFTVRNSDETIDNRLDRKLEFSRKFHYGMLFSTFAYAIYSIFMFKDYYAILFFLFTLFIYSGGISHKNNLLSYIRMVGVYLMIFILFITGNSLISEYNSSRTLDPALSAVVDQIKSEDSPGVDSSYIYSSPILDLTQIEMNESYDDISFFRSPSRILMDFYTKDIFSNKYDKFSSNDSLKDVWSAKEVWIEESIYNQRYLVIYDNLVIDFEVDKPLSTENISSVVKHLNDYMNKT